jgi:hypothetical protein
MRIPPDPIRRLARFQADIGARFTTLTWTVGINAAATIAIVGVLLYHR